MKTEQPVHITSVTAGSNITKNLFVTFNGNVCPANVKALGVSNVDADAGEKLPVVTTGIALVYSGAAITLNGNGYREIVSDANGKAVSANSLSVTIPAGGTPVTSTSANPTLSISGGFIPTQQNGFALDAASGADELIRVLLV